jgi:hypothetical protein
MADEGAPFDKVREVAARRVQEVAAQRIQEIAGPETRGETDRMILVSLQSLVERYETLEARVPTSEQLDFLTARMEDQRWQAETWRRLSRWGGRLLAALGALGLIQTLGLKPLETIRQFLGGR